MWLNKSFIRLAVGCTIDTSVLMYIFDKNVATKLRNMQVEIKMH